jgi:ferric-dicitrate binding protein FerR (iron transport regulator)
MRIDTTNTGPAVSPMRARTKGAGLAIALLLGVLPGTGSAGEYDERVPAEPGGRLRIDLSGGSVEIEGHDEETVRVEANASGPGANAIDFELTGTPEDLRLRSARRGIAGWFAGRVRVRVRVPNEFSLDVRTSGGSIEVEEIEGRVDLRTSGGDVRVSEIEGPVELRTSGGSIEAEEIGGDLEAETSGGSIEVREIDGRVDVRTSGGSLKVHDVDGAVRARTSGGTISVRFSGAPEGDVETSGGWIEVEYPEGDGFDLNAESSGGPVELDERSELEGKIEPHKVRAEVNGGGPKLRLRTSGGYIRLRAR